jgi:hypothetical protein
LWSSISGSDTSGLGSGNSSSGIRYRVFCPPLGAIAQGAMELDTTTMNWKQGRAMTAWQGRKERLLRRTHKSVRARAAGLVSEQFHAATFCQIVLRASSCFLLPVDATILNFQSAKQTKWVQIFDCDISRNSKEKFSSVYDCAFQFSMPMCYLALTTVLYHSVSPYTVSLSCCYRCCCRIGSQSDGRSTWRYGIFVESERDRRSTQAVVCKVWSAKITVASM